MVAPVTFSAEELNLGAKARGAKYLSSLEIMGMTIQVKWTAASRVVKFQGLLPGPK